jgi:hypothetical protein
MRRNLRNTFISVAIVLVLLGAMSWRRMTPDSWDWIVPLVWGLAAAGFLLVRNYLRSRDSIGAYQVRIGPDFVEVETARQPARRLEKLEIDTIFRDRSGNYVVKDMQEARTLLIVDGLEHPEEVEAGLAALAPIEAAVGAEQFQLRYQLLWWAILACFLVSIVIPEGWPFWAASGLGLAALAAAIAVFVSVGGLKEPGGRRSLLYYSLIGVVMLVRLVLMVYPQL